MDWTIKFSAATHFYNSLTRLKKWQPSQECHSKWQVYKFFKEKGSFKLKEVETGIFSKEGRWMIMIRENIFKKCKITFPKKFSSKLLFWHMWYFQSIGTQHEPKSCNSAIWCKRLPSYLKILPQKRSNWSSPRLQGPSRPGDILITVVMSFWHKTEVNDNRFFLLMH